MSRPSDLSLYLAVYKLVKYLYLLVKNFPKSYKYTLGQNILDLAWETLDLVIQANSLPNKEKPEPIRQASTAFNKLKIRLRLAHEIKLKFEGIDSFPFSLPAGKICLEEFEESKYSGGAGGSCQAIRLVR